MPTADSISLTLRLRSTLAAMQRKVRQAETRVTGSLTAAIPQALNVGHAPDAPAQEIRLRFAGRTLGLFIRPVSLDRQKAQLMLRSDSLLRLPEAVQPRVILDIGAGIGLTTLYFALTYPQAQVIAFEPQPDNVALLRHNVERHCTNVRVVPRGLSDSTGRLALEPTDGPGSGRLVRRRPNLARNDAHALRPVTTVRDALRVLNIPGAEVVHLNAPGTELAVLHGMSDAQRQTTQAYVGQLHGYDDFDFCALLSRTHDIALTRRLGQTRTPFVALRRDLSGEFSPMPGFATGVNQKP